MKQQPVTDGAAAPHIALDLCTAQAGARPAKRGRGRPLKPKPTNQQLPVIGGMGFDAVAAAIARIPRAGMHTARDRARLIVARDPSLPRSAVTLFDAILAALNRNTGRCPHSMQTFAKQIGVRRNTVARAFKRLKACNYVLRRRIPKKAGEEFDTGETTVPILVAAWQLANAELGPEKSSLVPKNRATELGPENGPRSRAGPLTPSTNHEDNTHYGNGSRGLARAASATGKRWGMQ